MSTKPYHRYMLDGITTNSFTDKQLLPVEDVIESTYNVKSIVNKKIINKKKYYLVQYVDKDRLWMDKDDLFKDNLINHIENYELNQLPESYIGMKIRKQFNDGKLYDGLVSKYDKKNKWFKVKYDDNDEENLNLSELKKILIYTKMKPKNKPTKEIRK